jgi:hypothetical protein
MQRAYCQRVRSGTKPKARRWATDIDRMQMLASGRRKTSNKPKTP